LDGLKNPHPDNYLTERSIMAASTVRDGSVLGLVRDLTRETKSFIRGEIQLAKAELSEKISNKTRAGTQLAIGGFVAYAGLLVFLIGLGWLVAFFLRKAGLQPLMAEFVGIGAMGLIVVAVGSVFLMKALSAISKESLVPERTVHTLQELRGKESQTLKPAEAEVIAPKVSSKELEKRVERTGERMGETIEELGECVKPSYIKARIKARVSERIYRNGLIAMGVGVLSGLMVRAKLRRA
jgi:hypothetical protein